MNIKYIFFNFNKIHGVIFEIQTLKNRHRKTKVHLSGTKSQLQYNSIRYADFMRSKRHVCTYTCVAIHSSVALLGLVYDVSVDSRQNFDV